MERITAGSRPSLTGTARSAFPAVALALGSAVPKQRENRVEWREFAEWPRGSFATAGGGFPIRARHASIALEKAEPGDERKQDNRGGHPAGLSGRDNVELHPPCQFRITRTTLPVESTTMMGSRRMSSPSSRIPRPTAPPARRPGGCRTGRDPKSASPAPVPPARSWPAASAPELSQPTEQIGRQRGQEIVADVRLPKLRQAFEHVWTPLAQFSEEAKIQHLQPFQIIEDSRGKLAHAAPIVQREIQPPKVRQTVEDPRRQIRQPVLV